MAQKHSESVVQQVIGKVKETAGKVLGSKKTKTEGKRDQVAARGEPAPTAAKGAGGAKAKAKSSPTKAGTSAKSASKTAKPAGRKS